MRVRFAPSPTGLLHIGGARTALYNWLCARQSGGAFVLRIEDTDRERSSREAVKQILDSLRWLDLEWDEGPFSQYERRDRHRARLDELLEAGRAYRSTATAGDVRLAREAAGGSGFRGQPAAAGEEAAMRLRLPDTGETVVHDLIRGEARFENRLLDDPVIARSDGTPLYNLAVAVDDLEMGITHVVRGEDHLSNTPKQLLVLEALGAEPPVYAHLPLLHGPDGKKLSKRHGAVSVQDLADGGFLPAAVRNYLALLGWGFDEETTFFSTEDLVEKFSLERVSRSPAVFDETKLRWMNGHYIRRLGVDDLEALVGDRLAVEGRAPDGRLRRAVGLAQEKIATLAEFWNLAGFFFERPDMPDGGWQAALGDAEGRDMLRGARAALAQVDPFDEEHVERSLRDLVKETGAKPRAVFQPVRVAISGRTVSPGIFESLALLGRDEALARIDAALDEG